MTWKPTTEQLEQATAISARFNSGFPHRAPHSVYVDRKLDKLAILSHGSDHRSELLDDAKMRRYLLITDQAPPFTHG